MEGNRGRDMVPEQKLTIERVDNGFIVTFREPDEDEGMMYNEHRQVFTEGDGEFGYLEAFIGSVWCIAGFLGVIGTKHDERRFWVGTIGKGKKGRVMFAK